MTFRCPTLAPKIRYIRLNSRHPAVSVTDLALMLEIDLTLHRRSAFRGRLQRALDDAGWQGAGQFRREEAAIHQLVAMKVIRALRPRPRK